MNALRFHKLLHRFSTPLVRRQKGRAGSRPTRHRLAVEVLEQRDAPTVAPFDGSVFFDRSSGQLAILMEGNAGTVREAATHCFPGLSKS